jgi:hypothetical protein
MVENYPPERVSVNGLDLNSIVAVLWKYRKLIIIGTIGATLIAAGASLALPRVYRSEGFFQLGNPQKRFSGNPEKPSPKLPSIGVAVPVYKRSASQFFNPERLHLSASLSPSFGAEGASMVVNRFRTAEEISHWFKPVSAFAKEDARELGTTSMDEANSVIGLSLTFEAGSPELAAAFVELFGYHVRDCLLYLTLYNYVMEEYAAAIGEMSQKENRIFSLQFALRQNINKMKDIQAILAKYPSSAEMENRQLVSVQEGGSRFLAPVSQLVGIESALADLRVELAELEWGREKLKLRMEFFLRCLEEIGKTNKRGELALSLLKTIKEDVFKGKDLTADAAKEVFNDLSVDVQGFELVFFNQTRFISGPTVPGTHIRPRKSLIVIVSGFAAFVFFVLSAFALHWWSGSRNAIVSADPSGAARDGPHGSLVSPTDCPQVRCNTKGT